MKNLNQLQIYLLGLTFLLATAVSAQAPQNADSYVRPYSNNFEYGANMGYYSNGWNDEGLASLISKAGGRTMRTTLADHFIELYGTNIRLNAFKYYVNTLGMKEIVTFVEGPSTAHRDQTVYPNCPEKSKLFANLYEPIWNADGTVNSNNYYATYIYKVASTYGAYIKFWEVVNEPDFSGGLPSNWLTRAPYPSELPNLWAPVYHYIRMMRITWEVVKKYYPNSYVCPGGLGYSEFLDCMLRYTDNPVDGSVTAEYPNRGGAYFDVVSYHYYPAYTMRYWDNSLPGFRHTRTSDYAASKVVQFKNELQTTLNKYGYNGVTKPKKHFIITESNVSRRSIDIRTSSDEMQRNFGIKSLVLAQKYDIKQLYFYMVGEAMNAPSITDLLTGLQDYALMGLYENLKRDAPGQEKKTDLGKALNTTSKLLYGYSYDAARTAEMSLPSSVEGGAFKKDNEYIYVLWAKALTDQSENASAQYTFPVSFGFSNVTKFEWNYSATNHSSVVPSYSMNLTAAPVFLKAYDDIVLSVEMFNFSAKRASYTTVELKMQDFTGEKATYKIERSNDGVHFSTIASIDSTDPQNRRLFYFTDRDASDPKLYYRVIRIRSSGTYGQSNVIEITNQQISSAGGIKLFPNPARGTINFLGLTADSQIKVIDLKGRLCKEYKGQIQKMDVTFLPSGMYFVHITNEKGTSIQKIFVAN